MPKPMMTICTQCKHYLKGRGYNRFCKAHPLATAIDPVDGETKHYLGDRSIVGTFTSDKYRQCRAINTGKCPKFQKN